MKLPKMEPPTHRILTARRMSAERRPLMAISGSEAQGKGYLVPILTALLAGFMLLSYGPAAFAQQAVFLVRHADRLDSSPDSPLSQAGKARAEHLALLLQHSGINAVYTSELQRTIMTAEPLATALKIRPVSIPRTDVEGLFQHIRSRHSKDDVVLVISHHKTIPLLLKLFGHQRDFLMEWHEYDNLLVLIPNRDQEPTLLRLHY
jgi:broad specificity phosphatase PhoE